MDLEAAEAALRKLAEYTRSRLTLTPERKRAADDVAERWRLWVEDPDRNPAPSRKANATRLKQWKARHGKFETTSLRHGPLETRYLPDATLGAMSGTKAADPVRDEPYPVARAKAHLRALAQEGTHDPEPSHRDAVAHLGWAQREHVRQIKARRHTAVLYDYAP